MTTKTISQRALEGDRVPVRSNSGIPGYVYTDGVRRSFLFECHGGIGEGVTEPICFVGSDYLDRNYQIVKEG